MTLPREITVSNKEKVAGPLKSAQGSPYMPPALETLYSYLLVVYFNFKGAERCGKPAINKVPAILLRSKFTQKPDL